MGSMETVRVLITGGAGFIGSHVADQLIAMGCKVAILDSLVPQVHPTGDWPLWLSTDIERRVKGDVRDRALVQNLLDDYRPHCVIHLAAEVGVGQAEVEIGKYVDNNVNGTATLLEAILDSNQSVPAELDGGLGGVRRLIVAGSMSAYGEGQWVCPVHGPVRTVRTPTDLLDGRWVPRCPYSATDDRCNEALQAAPIPEWASLRPGGVYAATKRDQEELSLLVGNARGLSVAVARFFNVYGPRQAANNPYTGIVVGFGARVRQGLRPRIYEDGGQLRDFVHVTDVARAVWTLVGSWQLTAAIRRWQTPAYQGPFNVGTGQPTSVLDVARLACQIIGDAEIEPEITGQFRAGDIRACVAEPSRIVELDWQPIIDVKAGIGQLYTEIAAAAPPEADLEAAHRQIETAGLLISQEPDPSLLEPGESEAEERAKPSWG